MSNQLTTLFAVGAAVVAFLVVTGRMATADMEFQPVVDHEVDDGPRGNPFGVFDDDEDTSATETTSSDTASATDPVTHIADPSRTGAFSGLTRSGQITQVSEGTGGGGAGMGGSTAFTR